MDALNAYGVVVAVVVAMLSGGATFFNKQRYTTLITQLQAGNEELRHQNQDLRDERTDLNTQLATCKARDEEKERLIDNYRKQPNLTSLTKLISSNHKEVMAALAKRK